MSSPEKKKKRKTTTTKKHSVKKSLVLPPTPESTPIPSLPDDLLVSCLARVSTLYYPTLSLVSKRFQSLLTSTELHEARSLLGRNESCLFVCFWFYPDRNPRWFTLCHKPDQTLTNDTLQKRKKKKKSSRYVLAPIPVRNSPQALWEEGLVALGSTVYHIGGPINEAPSSSVSILDCRSHAWHEAPIMRVERRFATVNVYNGKIYVAGGCKDYDSSNWMEVFDPKSQTWELVSSPLAYRCGSHIHKSAVIEEEIVMFGRNGVGYKPNEDRWEMIGWDFLDLEWGNISYCVIDNVLYCYVVSSKIKWYDSKRRYWMDVKGLESLPKFASYALVKLVDYSGKMVVLWDKFLPSSGHKKKVIWCAVIAVERRDEDEIWGNIEWLDGVLTVPKCHGYLCAVAATV